MEQEQALEVTQPHTLELIQRAEIDQQVSTAKKYPRDLAKVKSKMLSFATLDEETAESCFYTLKRKSGDGDDEKKTIQGPSVRLAEIAVACYGNLRAASRIIDNDGKAITSQGVCHDLENNTLVSVEVKRRITRRDGRTFSEDMQVVTGNAANSIAFRNAVFKVIPGALTKPVYEAAKLVAVGTASTLQVKRDRILKRLNQMGVENPRILAVLEKASIEFINLDDLETLIGLGTAIKDGDTSVDEAFPVTMATATETAKEKLKSNLRKVSQKDVQVSRAHEAAKGGEPPEGDTKTPPPGTSNGPATAAEGAPLADSPRPPVQADDSGEGQPEGKGAGKATQDFSRLPVLDRLPNPASSVEEDYCNVNGRIYQFLKESWMFYGPATKPAAEEPPADKLKFGEKPPAAKKGKGSDAGDFT